jgi:hypothetical protein
VLHLLGHPVVEVELDLLDDLAVLPADERPVDEDVDERADPGPRHAGVQRVHGVRADRITELVGSLDGLGVQVLVHRAETAA